ncbi:hypothetical protein [Methylophilus sp. 14]|uniref:hypothetical protein n=1 Tax=Methylophilus sp. 14 TaxID=2781019 RepID=UPI00188FAADF|nr:hypothetical protein [Methylophilus sp. 14]MBF4986888.1 hypothetical protein [Methylophilus sp. 14]
MEHIVLSDKSDLDNFDQIDISHVFSGKKVYERHLIGVWLKSEALLTGNEFPVDLIHDDKPDFYFKSKESNQWVGVEVTRACNMAQKEVKYRLDSSDQAYCYSANSFTPFMTKKKAKELVNAISAGDEVQVGPLMGDEPERRWAAYLQQTMYKKKTDFNKANFKKFSKNILLINVEIPGMVAVRDFDVALSCLSAGLFDFWHEQPTFDSVFILHDDLVIEIDATSVVIHQTLQTVS